MNTYQPCSGTSLRRFLMCSLLLLGSFTLQARILDNFDDNTKSNWTDFTFVPGFGLPLETEGQFRFEMPPAGQSIFSASQKTSEEFELKEGRTIEFRVDIVEGGAKDSFAVLAFIPTGASPGTLAGYGFAKSTTDILITKAVGKYFVADAGPAAHLKNDNITLVLNLKVKDGNVIVTATALDKDADNAVLWTKTVIDTPGADVMADGTDSPAAPFITKGYFTLYLYQDFDSGAQENPYKVYFDNAEVFVNDTTVLDNFDDGVKTNWQDFTFIPDFGLPQEAEGQFRFEMPPVGQAIFSASQKTSRVFELKEGERTEFQVDLIEGGAKDSFAVLAFIPTAASPGTLAGYGFAKSTTDILITKAVGKYFVADDGPAAHLKNDNITMILGLEVRGGSVYVHARALDRDADNAVLWEKTIIDTPGADVMADGTDSPAAPFITGGYFTLYLYQDFDSGAQENPYKVYFDNAIVSAPPIAANVAPLLVDIAPANLSNFLPATASVAFTVSDDKAITDSKLSITLNGVAYTTANGLVVAASGANKVATLTGKLVANVNYTAVISATDSDNATTARTIYFDTFAIESLVVEVEDYNFDGGNHINNPTVLPEGSGPEAGAYSMQVGTKAVDYSDTRTSPRSADAKYRSQDTIRMQHSLDKLRQKFVTAGGAEASVFDYDVGDIAAGEWMNYTREFPSGAYEVYLREALANLLTAESVLELVTGDHTQENQTTTTIGSFLGTRSGFEFRNFPLTDGSGQNRIRLNLDGITTLRLRQVTPDGDGETRFLNYLVFIRVGDKEVRRAGIASVSPAPNSTEDTVAPVIRVQIQNADTTVNASTIQLTVNGSAVVPQITSDANGATVTYPLNPLPVSGAVNSATVRFRDNQNQEITSTWSFAVGYKSLDPANRVFGTPGERGFSVHVVQSPAGAALDNSLARAEEQIKANSSIARAVDVTEIVQVINMNKQAGGSKGAFPDDAGVPGIDPATTGNGNNDFTVESVAYLALQKGVYRFGMISDDGYKLNSGQSLHDGSSNPLAFHNGGPGNETVDFVVTESGLYPVRFLWYERGGDAYGELSAINITTGERLLINDPAAEGAIKAYINVVVAPVIQSTGALGTAFGTDAGIVVDAIAKQVRIPIQAGSKFVKISWPSGVSLKTIHQVGNTLVVAYE